MGELGLGGFGGVVAEVVGFQSDGPRGVRARNRAAGGRGAGGMRDETGRRETGDRGGEMIGGSLWCSVAGLGAASRGEALQAGMPPLQSMPGATGGAFEAVG